MGGGGINRHQYKYEKNDFIKPRTVSHFLIVLFMNEGKKKKTATSRSKVKLRGDSEKEEKNIILLSFHD